MMTTFFIKLIIMHDKKNYEKYVYINFSKLKKRINIKKGIE